MKIVINSFFRKRNNVKNIDNIDFEQKHGLVCQFCAGIAVLVMQVKLDVMLEPEKGNIIMRQDFQH